jgi:hypothetical protein
MNTEVTIDPQPDKAFDLQNRRLTLDAGWLGGFFGTGPQASTSITGLVVLILACGGLLMAFLRNDMTATEYWKIASPIITGGLGFIFGRKT